MFLRLEVDRFIVLYSDTYIQRKAANAPFDNEKNEFLLDKWSLIGYQKCWQLCVDWHLNNLIDVSALNFIIFTFQNVKSSQARFTQTHQDTNIFLALAIEGRNMNQNTGYWGWEEVRRGRYRFGIDVFVGEEMQLNSCHHSQQLHSLTAAERWGEKERSFWASCPVSCFINNRLIFHTCAVLGDIGSYTRQGRVHRFLDSFPKRERERKGKRTKQQKRSLYLEAVLLHIMNLMNTELL